MRTLVVDLECGNTEGVVMCEVNKPRFRVDEPVYVKMNGYNIPGHIKTIIKCYDSKDGIDREYFIYTVDDEQRCQIRPYCSCITDVMLVERWEKHKEDKE